MGEVMIVKGYNIECEKHNRLLHEHVNEYGINLSHKEKVDIFKASMKPRNCVKNERITKKR